MMPQQVQLVQPQFQMMSNQPTMLVNPQGQLISGGQNQLQIINHGAVVPQSGQSGQQVHTVPSGATLVQAGSQQLANGTVTIQLAEQKVEFHSWNESPQSNFTMEFAISLMTVFPMGHRITVCPRTKQTQILQNHDQEQLHNSPATVNLHTIVRKPRTQARDRLTLIDHSFLVSIPVMKATT